jgi:hypothetical protein
MSGIYPESLKQCFPALRDIPEEPEEFRLASKNHQRVSLVDGEFITLNAAGWFCTTGRNWLPLDGRRAGPNESGE